MKERRKESVRKKKGRRRRKEGRKERKEGKGYITMMIYNDYVIHAKQDITCFFFHNKFLSSIKQKN